MDEKLMVRDKGGFMNALQNKHGALKELPAEEIDELYSLEKVTSILVPFTQAWRTNGKGKLLKIYHLN